MWAHVRSRCFFTEEKCIFFSQACQPPFEIRVKHLSNDRIVEWWSILTPIASFPLILTFDNLWINVFHSLHAYLQSGQVSIPLVSVVKVTLTFMLFLQCYYVFVGPILVQTSSEVHVLNHALPNIMQKPLVWRCTYINYVTKVWLNNIICVEIHLYKLPSFQKRPCSYAWNSTLNSGSLHSITGGLATYAISSLVVGHQYYLWNR